jgi:hypothetical protein
MKFPSDVDISPIKIVNLIVAVVEGNGGYSDEKLKSYAGFTANSLYFDRCVEWGIELRLVHRRQDDMLAAIKEATKRLREGLTDTEKERAFAAALLKYKPFAAFLAFLGRGLSAREAAQRVRAHFDIENTAEFISNLFSRWGLRVGILKRGVGRNAVALSDDIKAAQEQLRDTTDSPPESQIARRLKIESVLGPDAFAYLHEDEITDYVEALDQFSKNPGGAVNKAGAAAEDVLRRIATELGLPGTTKANGLAELAEALYNRKDGNGTLDSAIHDKHKKLAHAVAAIRVMGAHGKDKKFMERWSVSPESALAQIYLSLGLVRGVFAFVKRGGLLEI